MPAPIKLLHIISSVDPRGGGPVEGIKQRGAWLVAHGHTVEVLSLDPPDAEWVRQFPLKVHATGPTWLGGYHWTPQLAPWLRQHAGDYDHIVINGLWQYHCAGAARVLRGMGLPYHVFTHGMLDPWFKRTYPFKHLKKWVYWLLAEHHTLRHARRVLFTTEEERRLARQSFSPYQVNEAVVSYGTGGPPPGASELTKDFHELHPELEGKHLLLYLSRVHVKKGCDLLIEAWARVAPQHPSAHLLIAGTGDPTTLLELHAQARELHVAHRITWLGMVSGDAKWGAFYASRAFVLPSHQENFGIAVAEALACGLPVLISDKVNTWREIDQDGAGFVAPDTTDGTADNLGRWLALAATEQAQMSDAARRCAASRYSVEAMAQSLLTTLRNSAATPIESNNEPATRVAVTPGSDQYMSKPMRLLHVVSSVDPQLGGVAESIRARGIELVKMGHQVEVVCLDEPDSPFIRDYALPVHALGKGLTQWQFKPSLARWLKVHCQRFDAVIVDGLWQYHGIATRNALRRTGVPYYVLPHGMLDPWFKRTYPLKHLKKWLVWPWAEYRVLRDAAAVLFTCEEERLLASKSFWLYEVRDRVAPLGTSAPTGDDTALAQTFRSTFPALQERPFLLFLGRIHPKKGCDILLDAFAKVASDHPGQQLVMAGPGNAAFVARLKTQADRAGIADRVHWVGMLTSDTKWGALYASEAFVLPSHQENFGIAVAEALACGRPVLVSNKVNIWREAIQDECGLVAEDTTDGIADLLKRWYQQTIENRAKLASSARKSYEMRYTSQSAARSFLDKLSQRVAP